MPSMRDYSPFVPFDLYDFFGYLFPGVFFTASAVVFLEQIRASFWLGAVEYLRPPNQPPFLLALGIAVAAVVTVYVLGHVVAMVSYVAIDRVLLEGVTGYPVESLLKIDQPKREYSEATFKYLFVAFNLALWSVCLPDRQWFELVVLGSSMAIALLVFFRSLVMIVRASEKGKEMALKLGNCKLFRVYLWPSVPIDWAIGFVQRLLGLDRPFPDDFIALYKTSFWNRFGLVPERARSENYWLPCFHVAAIGGAESKKLDTWLHLYGFSRNACAAAYLSCSVIVAYLVLHPSDYAPEIRYHAIALLAVGALLGLRYWNLYCHYYTKGVIRTFVESVTRSQAGAAGESTQSGVISD